MIISPAAGNVSVAMWQAERSRRHRHRRLTLTANASSGLLVGFSPLLEAGVGNATWGAAGFMGLRASLLAIGAGAERPTLQQLVESDERVISLKNGSAG